MGKSLLVCVLLAAGLGRCCIDAAPRSPSNVTVTAAQLLRQFGYPHEGYRVVTDDGYVLSMDRIPRPGAVPVFMAPPLFCGSTTYLVLGPGAAQALMLHDAGFDVWLGNYRGSAYSPGHVRLSTADPNFWQFSWHEHGVYDIPASIDVVLGRTGFQRLLFVGFSMGSTAFFAMASSRPSVNAKIQAAFLQSPVASLYHSEANLVRVVVATSNYTEPFFRERGVLALPHRALRTAEVALCAGAMRVICNVLVLYLGSNQRYMDFVAGTYSFLETLPVAGSLPTLWHYGQQAYVPDAFRPYHFGTAKNMRLYGRATPPNYPLHRITVPIYTYRGQADPFTNEKDFEYLRRNLPTLVKEFMHPDPLLSHFEFVYSKGVVAITRSMIVDMLGELATQRVQ